jgi:hypothetical protein
VFRDPTSIDDNEESFSESSAEDKPKRVHVEEEDDDRKGHEQDDVNSGSNDAHILEMELLNGKVLNTPLEDDLSASPNSLVCLELRPPTTKRPTKRKKKRAEILTQSCIDDSTTKDKVIVIDHSTANAPVTVEALQAL